MGGAGGGREQRGVAAHMAARCELSRGSSGGHARRPSRLSRGGCRLCREPRRPFATPAYLHGCHAQRGVQVGPAGPELDAGQYLRHGGAAVWFGAGRACAAGGVRRAAPGRVWWLQANGILLGSARPAELHRHAHPCFPPRRTRMEIRVVRKVAVPWRACSGRRGAEQRVPAVKSGCISRGCKGYEPVRQVRASAAWQQQPPPPPQQQQQQQQRRRQQHAFGAHRPASPQAVHSPQRFAARSTRTTSLMYRLDRRYRANGSCVWSRKARDRKYRKTRK